MWFLGLAAATAGAADGWLARPVKARVAAPRAAVYSGPTGEDYATGHLVRGTEVEIFRSEPSGWLAIRPPKDSFSWVEASTVTLVESGQYRVVRDGAVCWIGSRVDSPRQFRWQVRLETNEIVSAAGKSPLSRHPAKPGVEWLRIVPPAGEFRWIRRSAIESNDGVARGTTENESSNAVAQAVLADSEPARGSDVQPVAWRAGDEPTSQWQRQRPSGPWWSQLSALQADVATEVAQSPARWKLQPLLRRAQALEQAAADQQAAEAAIALERDLERFVRWNRRRMERAVVAGSTAGRTLDAAPAVSADIRGASSDPGDLDFDGTGWLETVHSTKANAPKFALLDDDGKILAFVVPAPGLRLHRYVKRKVGIYGKRISGDDKENNNEPRWITARRVVKLR